MTPIIISIFLCLLSKSYGKVLTDIAAESICSYPDMKNELEVDRDKAVPIQVLLELKNNGNEILPPPVLPLQNNFAFRLDVVSKHTGGSVQSWQVSTTNEASLSLDINEIKNVTLGCTVNIASSECSDDLEICACIKSERVFVPFGQKKRLSSSFIDTDEENNIQCLPLKCKPKPGVEGDPHFLVYGSLNKLPLCFDIIGRAGEELILLNDTKAGWSVTAHVLDDKYFHAVSVRSIDSSLKITTEKIVNTSLSWNNLGGYVTGNIHLSIGLNKNEKFILVTTGKASRTIVVRVALAKHFDQREHLDIHVEEHDEIDEYIGGILGEAKKNYLGAETNVQSDRPYGAVFIKEKYFPAKMTTRGGARCWLVSPNQALYPYKVDNFIQH